MIINVTNRCIRALNHMYQPISFSSAPPLVPQPDIPPQPSCSPTSSFSLSSSFVSDDSPSDSVHIVSCDDDDETDDSAAATPVSSPPPSSSLPPPTSPSLLGRRPPSLDRPASRSQLRLLNLLRSQCASFVLSARSAAASSTPTPQEAAVNSDTMACSDAHSWLDPLLLSSSLPRQLLAQSTPLSFVSPPSLHADTAAASPPMHASGVERLCFLNSDAKPHVHCASYPPWSPANPTLLNKLNSNIKQHHQQQQPVQPVLSFVELHSPLPLATWSELPPHVLPRSSSFSSASTTVVPLIADRVALPESLNAVPLLNVLPPHLSSVYSRSQPASSSPLLRSALDVAQLNLALPLKPPRVAGSRTEYLKLIARLLSCGMISFTAAPAAVNGVFTVGKDEESDRLIIDAQPANRLFIDSPHVSLPDPSHLVQLSVPTGCKMYSAKSDLSNYYHHLQLPSWMQPFFALPPLSPSELSSLGLPPSSPSYPMCLTCPMGWSHAVLVATASHEHVLYSSHAVDPRDNLLNSSSPEVTQQQVKHCVEIDDFFLFSLSSRLATATMHRVLSAYRRAGFVVKQSKVVMPTCEPVKIIGFMVDGTRASVTLPTDSQLSLLSSTLAVLGRGMCTGLHLAHLIGRWTWCVLARRPALSVMQHVYRFVTVADKRRFNLWPSVRRELFMLISLLPLLRANLAAPILSKVVATDASTLGAGVVCTTLTPPLHRIMWPLCSSRSHAYMQTLFNSDRVSVDIQSGSADERHALSVAHTAFSSFYAQLSSCRWGTVISSPWRDRTEHINSLELRAVLLSLHWLLSYPSSHSSRVYLLVDSTVTFFSLWKGRSSSGKLLLVLRRIAALLLASGMACMTGWVPSEVNPADHASRLKEHGTEDEVELFAS